MQHYGCEISLQRSTPEGTLFTILVFLPASVYRAERKEVEEQAGGGEVSKICE